MEIAWRFGMKNKIGILIVLALIVTMLTKVIIDRIEDNKAMSSNVAGYEVDLTKENIGIKKGDFAPDVEMTDMEGNIVKLSDYRGKKVVLNFWATWCPPCRTEMPAFQSYYKKHQDEVEIIGFNMTFSGDSKKKVEQFVESYDLTFPIYLTDDDSIVNTYAVLTMPTTVFIDEEGRVQVHYRGPLDEKSLEKYISQLD